MDTAMMSLEEFHNQIVHGHLAVHSHLNIEKEIEWMMEYTHDKDCELHNMSLWNLEQIYLLMHLPNNTTLKSINCWSKLKKFKIYKRDILHGFVGVSISSYLGMKWLFGTLQGYHRICHTKQKSEVMYIFSGVNVDYMTS